MNLDADEDIGGRWRVNALLHGFSLDGEIRKPTHDEICRIGAAGSVELPGHDASTAPPDPDRHGLPC